MAGRLEALRVTQSTDKKPMPAVVVCLRGPTGGASKSCLVLAGLGGHLDMATATVAWMAERVQKHKEYPTVPCCHAAVLYK